MSKLAQALPHASQLTCLDVSSCNIGDEGVSDLADAISDPFHGIPDKAMLNEEFHGSAPTPAHLQCLKLRDNHVSDQGVQELGEAMQQSTTLQELDLAGNQVHHSLIHSFIHYTCLLPLGSGTYSPKCVSTRVPVLAAGIPQIHHCCARCTGS